MGSNTRQVSPPGFFGWNQYDTTVIGYETTDAPAMTCDQICLTRFDLRKSLGRVLAQLTYCNRLH